MQKVTTPIWGFTGQPQGYSQWVDSLFPAKGAWNLTTIRN